MPERVCHLFLNLIAFISDGTGHVLEFTKLKVEDSGSYFCMMNCEGCEPYHFGSITLNVEPTTHYIGNFLFLRTKRWEYIIWLKITNLIIYLWGIVMTALILVLELNSVLPRYERVYVLCILIKSIIYFCESIHHSHRECIYFCYMKIKTVAFQAYTLLL